MHGSSAPTGKQPDHRGLTHGQRATAAAVVNGTNVLRWVIIATSLLLLNAFTTPGHTDHDPDQPVVHTSDVTVRGERDRVAAASAPDAPFFTGAFLGDAASTPSTINRSLREYTDLVGSRPALVKTFYTLDDDFSSRGWAGRVLREIAGLGATNYVALAPRWEGAPETQLLRAISEGAADEVLRAAASEIARMDGIVLVEFAWEMNGDWDYPWQGAANGADSEAPIRYIEAWRHVVDLFREHGADNVRWVFAPNIGNPVAKERIGPEHWNWFGHYYPGAQYVDYVGAHGFNAPELWGGAYRDPAALFDGDGSLSALTSSYPDKPIIIGEFASEEVAGHDKGAWIDRAFEYLTGRPNVVGAVWFNMSKETDWQIDSSPSALAAFRGALRGPRIRTMFDETDLPSRVLRLASR